VTTENEDMVYKSLDEGKRVIAAIWHQRLFSALAYSLKYREFNPLVMISQSRDGDLVAPIAERLGLKPVRGSSSRGGKAALLSMIEALNDHLLAGHVVDGPRGPKGVVKPGLIKMAQISGAAIFPLFFSSKNAWITGSWDKFLIPKPFTQVLVRWGEPVMVPKDADESRQEAVRLEVEKRLREGHQRDDLIWKWKTPL
jgi:lysophospholipid acyltransferase (LPLAT)-like uncharacterized protein